MDKDKTIKELNDINRQLAKQLDQSKSELESRTQLENEITKTCVKDIIPICSNSGSNQANAQEAILIFSNSFNNPSAIEKNEEHEFSRRHTLVHLKSNSICTWIPKNSCSSLRFSIAKANGAI